MTDPNTKLHTVTMYNTLTGEVIELRSRDMLMTLAHECHQVSKSKGWWDEDRNPLECIALIHSELSEAVEGFRKPNDLDQHIPPFGVVAVELADTLIRIFDLMEVLRHAPNRLNHPRIENVAGAYGKKVEFNKTRPHRHGNKKF